MPNVLLVLRLVLGGLFLFAASVKLSDPQGFFDSVHAFRLPAYFTQNLGLNLGDVAHLERLATFVVPWLELLAGLALVFGYATRGAALVLSALLLFFLFGIYTVLARKMDVTCGCFGKFEIPCRGAIGWCHVGRNSVLLVFGLMVLFGGPGRFALEGVKRACASPKPA
jgi:uncharacterized membrane protein YphA (DoxX/SURF4 family)